ncbi:MAG: flagellar basal-body MS-ring/collar protein FliF, partial [Rhodospirillales bacterium]
RGREGSTTVDMFSQMLRNLGPTRLAVMGAVLLGIVGFFIFFLSRVGDTAMSQLYANLEDQDVTRITQELGAAGVPFELKAGGTEIFVPRDQVGAMRMRMAEQGLPSGGNLGYELFDNTDALGSTNFVQNVNLVRALEGELARTIKSIDKVRSARVHLVLPKRELFSRERERPSASVVLKMSGGSRLDKGQVAAVQHLVANAVPGLSPQQISIIDDRGTLLAAGVEDANDPSLQAEKADERRRLYENRMSRTVEELLERAVGIGKVRAQVSADMDFARVATNEETYDPEGQVVQSTQTLEELATNREADTPPVSVGENLPDPTTDSGDSATAESSESRTEETVNYAISKKVINHVREVGVVDKLSVAILVDQRGTWDEENETWNYQPRSAEEIAKLRELAIGAVGFDEARGDVLQVVEMRFAKIEDEPEPPLELFFGFDKQDLLKLAEFLVLSIVAILVILLVVRPLVSRAFESMPSPAAIGPDGRMLTDGTGAPALTGPGGAPVPTDAAPDEEEFDELIDIDRVEGRVKASSVKKVSEIVDKHPDEALSIVRNWMYQE